MRVLFAIAGLLAAGGALLLVLWTSGSERPPSTELATVPGGTDASERLGALDRRIAALEEDRERLERELDLLKSERRTIDAQAVAPAPVFVPEAEHSPEWYLEQYVLSFQNGGRGSEYFRLAVEAFAPSLFVSIRRHVSSASADELLRQRLLEILGDPRFSLDGRAIDVLLAIVRGQPSPALVQTALASLAKIGDERVARALEGVVWSLDPRELQLEAVKIVLGLSGDAVDACVARLLLHAPDDLAKTVLVSMLSGTDLAAVLDAFRFVSRETQPVRLAGANAIGRFHGEEIAAFIDEWLSYERDGDVRAALGRARGEVLSKPAWSAAQAEGPPDVANPANDDPKAWAARSAEMGEQWLELAYDPPLRANAVVVHEASTPGGVVRLIGIDERGARFELWSGVDPTPAGGPFEIRFATTERRLLGVRIVLDTNRRPGWEEIDAVELVGPEGNAWAVRAAASSSYAAR